jgi:L-ascorbate metabolism protein UlaG (beta-lactamase superfamily)
MTVSHADLSIEWYGYATVRLEADGTVVYLDPGRYGVLSGEWEADSEMVANAHPSDGDLRPEDGDVVCLTHVHHYDDDGVERVASEDATIVAFEGINTHDSGRDLPRLADLPYDVVEVGMEDETVVDTGRGDGTIDDVPLWTVPAYNEPDGPHTRADGTPFHPEGFGCGFLLALAETRVFWPGDTDVLDGHDELDVDVLLSPIGGSFTMDRHEAADLAAEMAPDLVVPLHYNTFDALETDSRAFAGDVAAHGIPVALDER